MRAKPTVEAEKFWPGGGIRPCLFGRAKPINKPYPAVMSDMKGWTPKIFHGPLFQSEGPWGLKTTCHVTHFSLQLASFFYGDKTQPHLNQPFPNCGSPPRPAGNETVNGTRQPCSSTVYGMHSTPPLGQHEEGGSATSLAMSTHQATIERQTPLLVWWSTKWFTICPFRLILTSMK